jgi:hypothetical protein
MHLPAQLERASKFGARMGIEYGERSFALVLASPLLPPHAAPYARPVWLPDDEHGHTRHCILKVSVLYTIFMAGFMSTTTNKQVAIHYGQDWDAERDLNYAMEFVLDSLNRGAMIQWLSQVC